MKHRSKLRITISLALHIGFLAGCSGDPPAAPEGATGVRAARDVLVDSAGIIRDQYIVVLRAGVDVGTAIRSC